MNGDGHSHVCAFMLRAHLDIGDVQKPLRNVAAWPLLHLIRLGLVSNSDVGISPTATETTFC